MTEGVTLQQIERQLAWARRRTRTDFSLQWALKDLDLMRAVIGPSDVPIALAIADRWRIPVDRGFGGLDLSAARHGLGNAGPAGSGAPPEWLP